jgi:uncharacterized protein DUF5685
VFGIIRPCRHQLGGELGAAWQAHLCGMCLALRGEHGQAARLATNYDGLIISVLAEAQADGAPERKAAGRCALRGMRKADVAIGACVRLAATVSLVLAAAKIRDHVDDGDGAFGRPGVRGAATALAARWAAASARTGGELGFEVGVLTDAIGRQTAVEAAAGPGTALLTVTEPTETATAAAFAHTAVLARKPANQAPLAEAGRLFGRIAHLVDAVEDLAADQASGAWNPLLATGTGIAEARRLCDDALLGIKLALSEAQFTDARLVHALLARELARSVHRVFSRAAGDAQTAAEPCGDVPAAGTDGIAVTGTSALMSASAGGAPVGCGLPVASLPAAGLGMLSGVLRYYRRRSCCQDCCCQCEECCCCELECCCCSEECGDCCCNSCNS